MSNIDVVENPVSLAVLLENINKFKFNPSNIQRVILDYLDDVSGGKVNIVDPTSPFVFLLEASCVNTSAALIENEISLRKQYPVLAQSVDDVYIHMSDVDFKNLFSTPSKTKFTFMIQHLSLLNNMVQNTVEDCLMVTIPRNTEVKITDITFSLQYPIVIRKYKNNVLQISFDNTSLTPLQTLDTNIISHEIKKDASGVEWVTFNVELAQFNIQTTYYALQASKVFEENISFNDSYYYCRVFYKNGSSSVWKEMRTTLTDQVYDHKQPTAVIKPNNETKTLNIFIPPIYNNSGLIDGSVRIDVYETKGNLNLDTSNFTVNAFKTKLLAIDEDNDVNAFTNAMQNVSMLVFSSNFVSGGSDPISFLKLRTNVIENAVGNFQTPITNVQLVAAAEKDGFSIVKNVDVVTNRIFLATRNLPSPTNKNLITAANITIDTLIANLDTLRLMDSVVDNTQRVTILPKTLYRKDNGKISIVTQTQVALIKALSPALLVDNVNSNNYLYSPFHYVLDNSANEFESRAYYLESPAVSNISFISQNSTAGCRVNTKLYTIQKIPQGYEIIVEVTSDDAYKAIGNQYVQAQLCYLPVGEINLAYINGTFKGFNTTTGERVFSFILNTNYDLDNGDNLFFTNFKMFGNEYILTSSPLVGKFSIFYTTNSVPVNYRPDITLTRIGSFLLADDSIGITEETIDVKFGSTLQNLWTRSRSVADGSIYQKHLTDVPLLYTTDVYENDPETLAEFSFDTNGDIVFTLLHTAGDPVLDGDGLPVYKYRAGDVMHDVNGDPIPIDGIYTTRHIDILFIDGTYYFTTDESHSKYKNEIATVISTWVTDNLQSIQDNLLEQTEIYFYPTSAIGLVDVMIDQQNQTTIEAKQTFDVALYVNDSVYNDSRIREQLMLTTIRILNESLKNTIVSISDIIVAMKEAFGNSVVTVKISGLGGKKNYETLTMLRTNESLSLNKVLTVQDDGSLIVVEDVNISFTNYSLI